MKPIVVVISECCDRHETEIIAICAKRDSKEIATLALVLLDQAGMPLSKIERVRDIINGMLYVKREEEI